MKIIAYWERGWFVPQPEQEEVTDWRMWEHLCRAYAVEFQMVDEWHEAVIPEGSKVYLLEEEGSIHMEDHVVDPDGVYVIGRSNLTLSQHIPAEDYEASIRIDTPVDIPLFGICAGSILLSRM